jgi:2-keto-4-pentenoate hydratase/2-oxohepta-3-ene-1,7-dioic acid hydratase in catechol pathway
MKLALFNDYIPGLVVGEQIIDLSESVGRQVMESAPPDRMTAVITDFERLRPNLAAAAGQRGRPLAEVRLRAPMPRPSKMLFGLGNYHENVKGQVAPLGLFLKSPSSILDPGGTVRLPPIDAVIFHHEAELAFVIGKRGKDIPEAEALDYIFGYTCIVDVSARGLGGGVLFIDKSPDTFCPMGPWITTRDEIPDPQRLRVRFWENEELRQDYNTDDMEHSVREIVAWASSIATLEVGDVFACGTNHQGLGPMQDGESGTIEVDGIGRMTVKVEDPQKRRWPFGIDRGVGKAVRQWKLTGIRPNPDEMFQTKRIA